MAARGTVTPEESAPSWDKPIAVAARRWRERHAVVLRRLRTALAVWSWISLTLFVVATVLVPSYRRGMVPALWCYYLLLQLFLLARTKTLTWRFTALAFTSGCLLAPLIGLTELLAAALLGLDVNGQDGAVLLAGPVEETLKLLPLCLVLLVARGRARRLAVVDFLLIGAASGLGFQAVEDAMRRIAQAQPGGGLLGLLGGLLGAGGQDAPRYGWGLLGGWWRSQQTWYPGHHVSTGLVAAGIGLALYGYRRLGWKVWLLPAGLLGMVIVDHAMFNAIVNQTAAPFPRLREVFGPAAHYVQVPGWLSGPHAAWGQGALQRPLLLVLLMVGLVADTRRTRRVWDLLPPLPVLVFVMPVARVGEQLSPPRLGPGSRLANRLVATVVRGARWLLWTLADQLHEVGLLVLAALGGQAPADGQQPPRRHRWGLTVAFLRQRRELAQALGRAAECPGVQPEPRVGAAVAATGMLAVLVVAWTHGGAGHPDGPVFFANLFDELGRWWNGLPMWQQALVIGGTAALLTLVGGMWLLPPLGLMEAVGIASGAASVASHGQGIATFLRDPRAATRGFLTTLTPGQLAAYGAELLAGRLLPAGMGAGLGRRLRWGLEDLASDPAAWRRTRALLLRELQQGDRGAIDLDGLLGRGGRDLAEYRLPTGKHVPVGRVRLDLEPATVKQVLDADPGTLTASERLLQQDYRRHLVDSHGAPLDQEALRRRLRDLRADGRSWVRSGTTPANSKYAGQRVFFDDPGLNRRYPDGVYTTLHGYPDFSSYAARRVSFPTTGEAGRDIRIANRLFQRGNDPMWRGVPPGETPWGWVWHHVQGGRTMILIPRPLHEAVRHAGGIATGPTVP